VALTERIRKWYRGKYVPPPPNEPNSPIVIVRGGDYEQPILAKLLRILGQFWLRNWKWIITTGIVVLFALIAA